MEKLKLTEEQYRECILKIKEHILDFVDDKNILGVTIQTKIKERSFVFKIYVDLDSKYLEEPFKFETTYQFSDLSMFDFELKNPYLKTINRFIRHSLGKAEYEYQRLVDNGLMAKFNTQNNASWKLK